MFTVFSHWSCHNYALWTQLDPRFSQSPINKVVSDYDLANHLSIKRVSNRLYHLFFIPACWPVWYRRIINPKKKSVILRTITIGETGRWRRHFVVSFGSSVEKRSIVKMLLPLCRFCKTKGFYLVGLLSVPSRLHGKPSCLIWGAKSLKTCQRLVQVCHDGLRDISRLL